MRLTLLISAICIAVGCASPPPILIEAEASGSGIWGQFQDEEIGQLVQDIDAVFSDEAFAHAHWGALIQSLDTGEVWYERNADRLFMPASNQKILTTATALLELGPNWTFTTVLSHTGRVADGTLHGDLVVRGNGDPTMYTRFQDEPRDVFRAWAAELREMGITRVSGNVIGDDNAWDDDNLDDDWPISNLTMWYGAPYGPLQFNENYVDLTFAPAETAGEKVTVTPNVPNGYQTIVNNAMTVEEGGRGISLSRLWDTNTIVVGGSMDVGGRSRELSPAIYNPTLFYVTVLTETLEEEGIEVVGGPVDIDDLPSWVTHPPNRHEIDTHQSPPLSEILTGLMKRSQNNYAETMVRTVAEQRTGLGSFAEGRRIVQERLAELGVEGEFRFNDGSGLSRYDYVSPRVIGAILDGMHDSRHWRVWYDTFPIAGVDGTLSSRMRDTPAFENVRAKTGTISNTRGLSGYVTTADGELLLFSFLVNGHVLSTAETNRITDSVCAMLASHTD